MKTLYITFVVFLLAGNSNIYANDLPANLKKALADSGLKISSKLKPQHLSADFNGDGKIDTVVSVESKKNQKKGLCILHSGSTQCIIIGAGKEFYNGGDDFRWADTWEVIPAGIAFETTFAKNGDIAGQKEVRLINKSLELCVDEGGCYVITFKNGKYTWVHTGD